MEGCVSVNGTRSMATPPSGVPAHATAGPPDNQVIPVEVLTVSLWCDLVRLVQLLELSVMF